MKTVIEEKKKKRGEISYQGRCTEKQNECLLLLLSFMIKSHTVSQLKLGQNKK